MTWRTIWIGGSVLGVVVLAALLAARHEARRSNHEKLCAAHLKQIGLAVSIYQQQCNDYFPSVGGVEFLGVLRRDIEDLEIFSCPASGVVPTSRGLAEGRPEATSYAALDWTPDSFWRRRVRMWGGCGWRDAPRALVADDSPVHPGDSYNVLLLDGRVESVAEADPDAEERLGCLCKTADAAGARRAVELHPDDPLAWECLVRRLVRLGDLDTAREETRRFESRFAHVLAPDGLPVATELAVLVEAGGAYDPEFAVRRHGRSLPAWRRWFERLFERRDWAAVERELERAGRALEEVEGWPLLRAEVRRRLEFGPREDVPADAAERIHEYCHVGETEAALRTFELALERGARDFEALVAALLRHDDASVARRALERLGPRLRERQEEARLARLESLIAERERPPPDPGPVPTRLPDGPDGLAAIEFWIARLVDPNRDVRSGAEAFLLDHSVPALDVLDEVHARTPDPALRDQIVQMRRMIEVEPLEHVQTILATRFSGEFRGRLEGYVHLHESEDGSSVLHEFEDTLWDLAKLLEKSRMIEDFETERFPTELRVPRIRFSDGMDWHARLASAPGTHRIEDLLAREFLARGYVYADEGSEILVSTQEGALGRPGFLDVLIDTLAHPDPSIRRWAILLLRRGTGHYLGYSVGASAESRAVALAAWRRWLALHRARLRWIGTRYEILCGE